MKVFQRIFHFYIDSSIHVSLAVCAMVAITLLEFSWEGSVTLFGFVFFGSITGYNFVKYAGVAGLHHRSLTDMLKTIQIFSLFCFGALIYFSFQLSIKTIMVSGIFGLFTLLYAVPFLFRKNLRTFSGVKIFVVALVWAGVTVIMPIVANNQAITLVYLFTFIQRFFIVIVLIIPFEIRDLQYDNLQLKTLPQLLGVKKTKWVAYFLLLITMSLEFLKPVVSFTNVAGLLFLSILLGYLVAVSKGNQSKYFSSVWVEAVPIFWFMFLVILKLL